jgi:hypothetical protein
MYAGKRRTTSEMERNSRLAGLQQRDQSFRDDAAIELLRHDGYSAPGLR